MWSLSCQALTPPPPPPQANSLHSWGPAPSSWVNLMSFNQTILYPIPLSFMTFWWCLSGSHFSSYHSLSSPFDLQCFSVNPVTKNRPKRKEVVPVFWTSLASGLANWSFWRTSTRGYHPITFEKGRLLSTIFNENWSPDTWNFRNFSEHML